MLYRKSILKYEEISREKFSIDEQIPTYTFCQWKIAPKENIPEINSAENSFCEHRNIFYVNNPTFKQF